MLASALLLLTALALSECRVVSQTLDAWDERDDHGKIVNGVATKPNAYPFIARLEITFGQDTYSCGGSVINSQWVLTAGHCIDDGERTTVTKILVFLGAHNIDVDEQSTVAIIADHCCGSFPSSRTGSALLYFVDDMLPPSPENKNILQKFTAPRYDSQTMKNDIAIVHLSSPVTFNKYISPICIARTGTNVVGQKAIVAGWGTTGSDMPGSSVLLETRLPILDDKSCNPKYPNYINDVMMCAGYTDGTTDSCQGDSGGPLFIRRDKGYTAVGVVSFGQGCAKKGYPGVYAEVEAFTKWIEWAAVDGGSICVA